MDIKQFLSSAHVVLDLQASDKFALLRELARRAASALGLPADAVAEGIAQRDELGSTGIGGGVAIPHTRLREVKKPFGIVARLKQPVEYNAIDEQPVDLVFLLLLPASSQLDQLNALAAVARRLRDPETLRRLRSASNRAELYQAIVG
jgi:PTS system nitrogen regulatory IIA component